MKPSRRQMIVDLQATLLRKPSAAPLVTPRECVAIALSAAQWTPGHLHSPESTVVDLVMKAFDHAGWEIRPKEAKRPK